MKGTLLRSIIATLLAVFVGGWHTAEGQMSHQHDHEHSEQVGKVNFPISCSPRAQQVFNRAAAWLHSFEYEAAEKDFNEVVKIDPKCAMGYWGVAMSNYHPIWAPPTAAELQRGREAVEQAKTLTARTSRERDYIAAIEQFYKDADKLDHRTRALKYGSAMEQLHKRYPADREAGILFALTLIAKGMIEADKTYVHEKRAAKILNAALARQPRHPGVAHYLIHSYDYPALAHLALPAARSYARIAPASAHAQHMPSHIFTRMGLWPEAINSNRDANSAAKAFAIRHRMPGAWDEQIHALDYLAYAYLQGAQDKQAVEVMNELFKIRRVDPPSFKVAYAFTAIPARYALERRQWAEAAELPIHPGALENFPWQKFRWAEAHSHYARAVGAARSGNIAGARKEVAKLTEIRQNLEQVKGDYDWAKQVEIQRQIASAWLLFAEGKRDDALKQMRAVADLDDATDKHPVTPGSILPAREHLGELLFEMGQPVAALNEFETSLQTAPNRFNGLYGAARSAKLAGDARKARTYFTKLVALTRQSDGARPELAEAKQFLSATNGKMSVRK